MIISGGGRNLLSADLKGKRQGKFLGLKHRFVGTYSHPMKIPSGVRSLTVHIESSKGSVNLTRPTALPTPNGKELTLHINASQNKLQLSW